MSHNMGCAGSHSYRPVSSALSLVFVTTVLLAAIPHAQALRASSRVDRQRTQELRTKAVEGGMTAYGRPMMTLLTKRTSVDHFSSVRQNSLRLTFAGSTHDDISRGVSCYHCALQAQYSRNDTFQMQYGLVWPSVKPTNDTPIYLFCAPENSIQYALALNVLACTPAPQTSVLPLLLQIN